MYFCISVFSSSVLTGKYYRGCFNVAFKCDVQQVSQTGKHARVSVWTDKVMQLVKP